MNENQRLAELIVSNGVTTSQQTGEVYVVGTGGPPAVVIDEQIVYDLAVEVCNLAKLLELANENAEAIRRQSDLLAQAEAKVREIEKERDTYKAAMEQTSRNVGVQLDKTNATAARERARAEWLREALEHVEHIAMSVQYGRVGGQQAGVSPWNMTVGTKKELLRTVRDAIRAAAPGEETP